MKQCNFISCISLCRTVSHLTYTDDTELQKPLTCACGFMSLSVIYSLIWAPWNPHLVLKFSQRVGKNALYNEVSSPHSEICPSQSFVNIWQSGAQFLKDLCLWLRTFFKSKSLSLQGGRELIFPHCRTAYSRHGYEFLHLRNENSILFCRISGFNPRWDTAEMRVPLCLRKPDTIPDTRKSQHKTIS